jgi:hypothetical protein
MASNTAKRRPAKPARERRTLAGWRANALDLKLTTADLDLLDNVIAVVPILCLVTAIGQEARRRRLAFPVASAAVLTDCLGRETLRIGDHRLSKDTIAHAMPESWFPIAHEGEFLSRVHLALIRCEWEIAQRAPRPVLQLK